MPRRITPQTTLDNLKKEARRFLKAMQQGDERARELLKRAWSEAPEKPVLRDIQYAIAREYGFPNWKALKEALEARASLNAEVGDVSAPGERPADELQGETLLARFFDYACPDHHIRGGPAHRMARHAALRILRAHPEIARQNLYTAIVCGEADEVERMLRERPELARAKSSATTADREGPGGSKDLFRDIGLKGWEPLLYLCFTRLDLPTAGENAVRIARLLLDHGADPNSYFMAGDSRYTPLVGAIGEGEEDRPPHPRRDELARLLLERGAEPYDSQVIYNIHFHGQILWWVKLMYEFSVKAGRRADWADPEWTMLQQGGYGSGARWHLWTAIRHHDLELAEWCLQHGATANPAPPASKHLPKISVYEQALRLGQTDMAELLARYGAVRVEIAPHSEEAFVGACFRRDRKAAEAILREHPEYLRSHVALHAAAQQDRSEVAELLLDLGVGPDVEDPNQGGQTALHVAAYSGARSVAETLVRLGAKIDPVDTVHDATPLWFATWAQREEIIELLAPLSRDLWALSFAGKLARLRALLAATPEIAKWSGESTPLFWLPEDDDMAAEIVDLFVAKGTDAGFRRKSDGLTAAYAARRRGLVKAAARLEQAVRGALPDHAKTAEYERLAADLVTAYATGDEQALEHLRSHYKTAFSWADLKAFVWARVYAVRQAGGAPEAFGLPVARRLIAREGGFPNWDAVVAAAGRGAAAPGPPYVIEKNEGQLRLRRRLEPHDWEMVFDALKVTSAGNLVRAGGISSFHGGGQVSDDVLAQLSQMEQLTALDLSGCQAVTDAGMQHLARMPQLEKLNLSGTKITDRGLEVLLQLPNLRTFDLTWQKGVSDAGVGNLRFCERLESVNVMGTETGDGVVRALRGKANLHRFNTGKQVTDAGLAMLHEFPRFRNWSGGECRYDLMTMGEEPTFLLLDGPFTDQGLTALAGLEGLTGLNLFWHVKNVTGGGMGVLASLPHLSHFRVFDELADDAALQQMGRMPHLRMLVIQGTVASDEGFLALSRSKTIEFIWGRECPKLTGRGFAALAGMPALGGLGVSFKNVDDAALARLPDFPALRELMPMDVKDDGFRHVGRCARLERLWCMYCRDTGDAATEHVAGLRLKSYYAGMTQITDRSLEILGRMDSLEEIEFFETKHVTDAGLAHLARLPRLRRVELSGLPNITWVGTWAFPSRVQVNYDV